MDKSLGINIIDKIGQIVNAPLNNQYFSTGILVLLVLYCGMLSTKLTNPIVPLLKSVYVKLLFGIVIIFTFRKNRAISLMLLVALVLTMQTSDKINTANKISEAITNNNNLTENMLLNEQIQLIINEENQKPESNRLSSEEIVQIAEERVQNILIEQTRTSENDIIPNEVTQQYSEAVPTEENVEEENVEEENVVEEQESIVEDNIVNEEIINKSLPAISRVIVEEEMKREAVLPNQTEPTLISGFDKRLITEESLNSVSENVPTEKVPIIDLTENVDGFDKSSPLEEQIQNMKGTQLNNNNTRSSRGLNVNKKCNLCTLKKPEQDLSNVNAYEGNTLASY